MGVIGQMCVIIHKSQGQNGGGAVGAATVVSAIVINPKAPLGRHRTCHVSTLLLPPLMGTLARIRYSVKVTECIFRV